MLANEEQKDTIFCLIGMNVVKWNDEILIDRTIILSWYCTSTTIQTLRIGMAGFKYTVNNLWIYKSTAVQSLRKALSRGEKR